MGKYEDKIWDMLEGAAMTSRQIRSSRHSAALVYKKKVLCIGTNKLKSHPIMQDFSKNPEKIFLHAEMDCIVRGINRFGVEFLSECEIYVLRLDRRGKRALSKPCECCWSAIKHFNLKGIKWTT